MSADFLTTWYTLSISARRECMRNVYPRWLELESRLLEIGGTSVAIMPEPHLEMLLERGSKFGAKSLSDKLNRCQCHSNVSFLWKNNKPEDFKITTGYALSADGIWRQHTWGRYMGTITIETTEKRKKYFGVVLKDLEAAEFVEKNPPEFDSEDLK